MGEENEMNAYMRGQVPGTTCNGARTNSAINNTQASSYIGAPEGVAQYLGLERHRTEVPKYQSTAPVAGATHYCKIIIASGCEI